MSFIATLETNIGDNLRLLLQDGSFAGNALLSFIGPLLAACIDIDNGVREYEDTGEIAQWISSLGVTDAKEFCKVLSNIFNAQYTGDWNYSEDDFLMYQERYKDVALEESEFRIAVRQVNEKWTSASLLLEDTNTLVQLFLKENPPETWWYSSSWTIRDFRALSNTLTLAISRGVEKVRIRFE